MHPPHVTLPVQKALPSSRKYKNRQLALSMASIQREVLFVEPEWLMILASRRKNDMPTTLYKIRRAMDRSTWTLPNNRRTRGQQRLYQPTVNVKVYKGSSFPRTIQDWNRLLVVATDSLTIEEFRAGLEHSDARWTTVFNCFNHF